MRKAVERCRRQQRHLLVHLRDNVLEPRGGMIVAKMTLQQLLSLWELLSELEGVAARLACERMSDAQVQALRRLHELFRSGSLDKRYLVLVAGRWTRGTAHVRIALGKTSDERGEKRVFADADGQEAYSIFRPLAVTHNASLLEACIKTGRTHQIRVHLAHLGFPVLGDERYGDFALNRALRPQGLRRMFLHARALSLVHPETGEALALRADLPDELRRFLIGIEGMREQIDDKQI